MGHIRRHPNAPNRWQVRYIDPTGRERSRNFAKKTDADRFLITVEADKLRGTWTDPDAGKVGFEEWALEVEAGRLNRRASTKTRDLSSLRNLILPTFGDMELARIRPNDIRRWVADLQQRGYAPATITKAYQILSRALRVAVADGLIPRSPAAKSNSPPSTPTNDASSPPPKSNSSPTPSSPATASSCSPGHTPGSGSGN